MRGSLDRDALLDLLDDLSGRLGRRKTRAQVHLIGGAAMSFAFDRPRATHDLDVRIDAGPGALVDAVREIARERGLPDSWLNEQATASIPHAPDSRARTVYESEYLTITGASAEHMLAVKLEAGRATDVDDVATLIERLEFADPQDALAIHARLFPDSTRRNRARRVLDAVFARRRGNQAPAR